MLRSRCMMRLSSWLIEKSLCQGVPAYVSMTGRRPHWFHPDTAAPLNMMVDRE